LVQFWRFQVYVHIISQISNYFLSLSFLSSFLCCKFLFGSWGEKKCKNQKGCLFKCSRFSFFLKKKLPIPAFCFFVIFLGSPKLFENSLFDHLTQLHFLTIFACLRRVKLILSKFFPKITYKCWQIRFCCECDRRRLLSIRNDCRRLGNFKKRHALPWNLPSLVRFRPWSGIVFVSLRPSVKVCMRVLIILEVSKRVLMVCAWCRCLRTCYCQRTQPARKWLGQWKTRVLITSRSVCSQILRLLWVLSGFCFWVFRLCFRVFGWFVL